MSDNKYLKFQEQVIVWLDGKKSYISALTLLVVPFLVSQGFLTNEWGQLITGIVAILVGGSKLAGNIAIKKGSELGAVLLNKRK